MSHQDCDGKCEKHESSSCCGSDGKCCTETGVVETYKAPEAPVAVKTQASKKVVLDRETYVLLVTSTGQNIREKLESVSVDEAKILVDKWLTLETFWVNSTLFRSQFIESIKVFEG